MKLPFEYAHISLTVITIFVLSIIGGLASAAVFQRPQVKNFITSPIWERVMLVLSASYSIYFSWLSIYRHNLLLTQTTDLGWEYQAISSIHYQGWMLSTFEGPWNYLSLHTTYLYWPLSLLLYLWNGPETLLVLQSFVLGFSGYLVFRIVSSLGGKAFFGFALGALFLSSPQVQLLNLFDFHPASLAISLILLAGFFSELRRWKPLYLCIILLSLIREEYALYAFCIGLPLLFDRATFRHGVAIAFISLCFFVLNCFVAMPHYGSLPNVLRFPFIVSLMNQVLGFSLPIEAQQSLAANYSRLLDPKKSDFIVLMFLPTLHLIRASKLRYLLYLLPGLALTLLSYKVPQYTVGYQYGAGLFATIFSISLLAVSQLKEDVFTVPIEALSVSILVFAFGQNYFYGSNAFSKSYKLSFLFYQCDTQCYNRWISIVDMLPIRSSAIDDALHAVSRIPVEATVTAVDGFVPHLKNKLIFNGMPPTTAITDYYIFYHPIESLDNEEQISFLRRLKLEKVFANDAAVIYKNKTFDPPLETTLSSKLKNFEGTNRDFERGDLTGWKATGPLFSYAPAMDCIGEGKGADCNFYLSTKTSSRIAERLIPGLIRYQPQLMDISMKRHPATVWGTIISDPFTVSQRKVTFKARGVGLLDGKVSLVRGSTVSGVSSGELSSDWKTYVISDSGDSIIPAQVKIELKGSPLQIRQDYLEIDEIQ